MTNTRFISAPDFQGMIKIAKENMTKTKFQALGKNEIKEVTTCK